MWRKIYYYLLLYLFAHNISTAALKMVWKVRISAVKLKISTVVRARYLVCYSTEYGAEYRKKDAA
jgi:hypothetical protein